jgi:hypothetical protein
METKLIVGVRFRKEVNSISFPGRPKLNNTFVVGLVWNQPAMFHLDLIQSEVTESALIGTWIYSW